MLITIGIPVYNASKYLRNSIQSVLNQSYTNFELIIIDDGSTDNSVEIIESYQDDRIIFIKDGENKALPYRLNQITNMAKGKYIARMDADDVMDTDRIKTQIELLEKHEYIDVLGTNCYIIDKNNNVLGIRVNEDFGILSKVNFFIHPTIMGKREWFLNNQYDEKAIRMEDLELWMRNDVNNFYQWSTPLLYYRELDIFIYKKYYLTIKPCFLFFMKEIRRREFKKGLKWFMFLNSSILKTIVFYILKKINKESILINKRYEKIY